MQTRQIILNTILKHQPNPLISLPPHLDPSVSYNGNPALISREAFQINVQNATAEAQRILNNTLSLPKLKELLALSPEDRSKLFATDSALRLKFQTSVTWYSKGAAGFPIPGRQGSQPGSGPSTPRPPPSQAVRPPPSQAGMGTTPNSNQVKTETDTGAVSRPPVPAQPVEPEPARRKRKMNEYLREIGPGLEYETEVTEVS